MELINPEKFAPYIHKIQTFETLLINQALRPELSGRLKGDRRFGLDIFMNRINSQVILAGSKAKDMLKDESDFKPVELNQARIKSMVAQARKLTTDEHIVFLVHESDAQGLRPILESSAIQFKGTLHLIMNDADKKDSASTARAVAFLGWDQFPNIHASNGGITVRGILEQFPSLSQIVQAMNEAWVKVSA